MFSRIVVPLDGSTMAERVLDHAVALGRALEADIVLLRVIEHEWDGACRHPADPLEWEFLRAEARAYLDGVSARIAEFGVHVETATAEGDPVEGIVDFARAGPRTLLVICSHGSSGISAWVLGGVAHKAALHAGVSFMVVRAYNLDAVPPGQRHYRRILVPLDGSRRAECVLPTLSGIARQAGSEVVVGSVVSAIARCAGLADDDPRRELLRDMDLDRVAEARRYAESVARRLDADGLRARTRVELAASPENALRAMAAEEKADLVVLAAHGGACGARLPFGAVPLNLLVYGETPLLVVQDLAPEEIEPTRAERMAREVRGH